MTKLFHKDKPLFGIDISTTGIKVMAVNSKNQTITGYGSIELDPGKLHDSLNQADDYLASGLTQLFKEKLLGKLPSKQVAVSLPTSVTYTRSLIVPLSSGSKMQEAVELEAEQYIPIPVTELYIDYDEVERDDKNMTIVMSAVPRRVVDSIMHACERNGLEVMLMEPGISAVDRVIRQAEEGHLPTLLVDIGAATCDIALVDGFIRVAGGVSIGGHTFTLKIADKLKVSLEEAHQLKVHSGLSLGPKQSIIKAALEPSLNQIVDECRKVIRYYTERLGTKRKIEQIIIVGGGANMPGLGEFMTSSMLMPARVGNPWQKFTFGNLPRPAKPVKTRYITAAGLSIVEPKEIWK